MAEAACTARRAAANHTSGPNHSPNPDPNPNLRAPLGAPLGVPMVGRRGDLGGAAHQVGGGSSRCSVVVEVVAAVQ